MLKLLVVAALIASSSYSFYTEGCSCTMEWIPVCGNDGKTYSSPCALACAQSTNPSLQQTSMGECVAKQIPTCTCSRVYMPVCGSNGLTYTNTCQLECAQRTDPNLQMLRKGSCDSEE